MTTQITRSFRVVAAAALLCAAVLASAAEPAREPSKEQRASMATLHEQMAQCLRSDKSLAECRNQMRDACMKLGKEGCPMAGMGMHDGMMHPASQPDAKN